MAIIIALTFFFAVNAPLSNAIPSPNVTETRHLTRTACPPACMPVLHIEVCEYDG